MRVQSANHLQRQGAFAVHHLVDTAATANDPDQSLRGKALLFKTKPDRIDGIGWIDRKFFLLVGLDQRRKNIETITRRGFRLRTPELLDLL